MSLQNPLPADRVKIASNGIETTGTNGVPG